MKSVGILQKYPALNVSELTKSEKLRVYLDLQRSLQDELDQLGFLKISEDAFKDWDNEEDDIYNDL